MTSLYGATSDPRQKHKDDGTRFKNWSVAPDDDDESIVGTSFEHEFTELVQKLDEFREEVESRPLKWSLTIYDLGDVGLSLLRPISVVVEEYPKTGTIGVSFPDTESYVEANNLADALIEIKIEIVDLYFELKKENPETLGRLPLRWHNLLSSIIKEE